MLNFRVTNKKKILTTPNVESKFWTAYETLEITCEMKLMMMMMIILPVFAQFHWALEFIFSSSHWEIAFGFIWGNYYIFGFRKM